MTDITLRIPDDLADMIRREGLLHPEALTTILRDALRRKAAGELLKQTESALSNQEMGEDEVRGFVESVIDEVRTEKQ